MTQRPSDIQRSLRRRKLGLGILALIIAVLATTLSWAGVSLKDLLAALS